MLSMSAHQVICMTASWIEINNGWDGAIPNLCCCCTRCRRRLSTVCTAASASGSAIMHINEVAFAKPVGGWNVFSFPNRKELEYLCFCWKLVLAYSDTWCWISTGPCVCVCERRTSLMSSTGLGRGRSSSIKMHGDLAGGAWPKILNMRKIQCSLANSKCTRNDEKSIDSRIVGSSGNTLDSLPSNPWFVISDAWFSSLWLSMMRSITQGYCPR